MELLYVLLIVFLAAFVQTTVGFGFALVAAPFLSFFISPSQTVLLCIMMGSVICIRQIIENRNYLRIKQFLPLLLFIMVGAIIPAFFLAQINEALLKRMIYLSVIVFSIVLLSGKDIRLKKPTTTQGLFGLAAGTVNTLVAINGPLLVLFLQNMGLRKREFVATVSALFLTANIVSITVLLSHGGITNINGNAFGIALVATIVGTATGIPFQKKLNETLFHRLVLILVLLTGLSSIMLM